MKIPGSILFWGMLISFLGSLPPGVMNLAATQIAGQQGTEAALIYSAGSMLAEVIIVRLALSCMHWLTCSHKFFKLLEWMIAGMLILFSAACFITADSEQEFRVIFPEHFLPPFFTGVLLSAINPLHIPFWLGWSTVLMNKQVLVPEKKQYNWYIFGIGLGTMAGFTLFIYGGQYLLHSFHSNQLLINCTIGAALLVGAFLHIKQMIMVPAAIRHARLFKRSNN